jgi:hypothetical protein
LEFNKQQQLNQMTWLQATNWKICKIIGLNVKVMTMRAILKTGEVIAHHAARLKSQFLNQTITIYIEDSNPSGWDLKS